MSIRREDVEARRVSISDNRIVSYLEQELTVSKSMLKTISSVLSRLNELAPEDMAEAVEDINGSKEEIIGVQRELLNYLSRASAALYHREDWIRIISKVGNVVDKFSGIAYRLEYLVGRRWTVSDDVKSRMVGLSLAVERILDLFSQTLSLMLVDAEKALRLRDRISVAESEVDELFRRTNFAVLESNLSFHSILLLLNIAEMLEDVSDTINAAADDAYIILLGLL